MELVSLELKNWRNFRQARVEFSRRTFVVGPNASGKTNLLDGLRFLRDIAAEEGGLQVAVKRRGGFSALRTLFAHGADSSVRLALACRTASHEWVYDLTLQKDGERARVEREVFSQDGVAVLERSAVTERDELRRQTWLQQAVKGDQFEDLVTGLRSIRSARLAPELLRTTKLHGDPELEEFGSRFLERVFTSAPQQRKRRLKKINAALKGLLPYFSSLDIEPDALGGYHLQLKVRHWRTRDAYQTEAFLSDGTLRLIALLWEILDGAGPLLLEEPELSLHAGAVAKLPALFARVAGARQLILSTHAFSMFREVGFAAEELVLVTTSRAARAQASVVRSGADIKHVVDALEHQLSLEPVLERLTAPPEASKLAAVLG